MLQFFLTNVLLVSLGAMLYLIARTMPRIEEEESPERTGILDRWLASEMPERIDAVLNASLEKFLRKLKIALLKVDNALNERLKKMKTASGAGNAQIDFQELTNGKNGGNPGNPKTDKVAKEGVERL